MLGEAGATVYCTGRSVRGAPTSPARPETIEETAEMVDAHGGVGHYARVDHTRPTEVEALFARVQQEAGRLDVLVNDIWGGDELTEWGTPFWRADLDKGFTMLDRAIRAHLITSRFGVPMMVAAGRGLVLEITDGDEAVNRHYRGHLFYDLAKVTALRMAFAMASDLRDTGVTAVALTPGFLRSEAMLDHFGVTAETWRDAIEKDPHFAESESPFYLGRAVAALAADPQVHSKTGRGLSTWGLAEEYGLVDVDGRQPKIGQRFDRESKEAWRKVVDAVTARLGEQRISADDSRFELCARLEDGRVYRRRLMFHELFMTAAEKLADDFCRAAGSA
jgi:NAD(P)-dependent dehydrogenase (short-subunit alcohol dehydrogenase family)